VTYTLQLTKERLATYVTGLDSAVRLIAQQMANHQSAGLALKELLPKLVAINNEFEALQELVNLPKEPDVPV